jgi:hypothetical protein
MKSRLFLSRKSNKKGRDYAKKENEKEGYLSCARRCFQPRRESRSLSNLKNGKTVEYIILKK